MFKTLSLLFTLAVMVTFCPASHAALAANHSEAKPVLIFEADDKEIIPRIPSSRTIIPGFGVPNCTFNSFVFSLDPAKKGENKPAFSELVVEKIADGSVNRFFLACVMDKPYKKITLLTSDLYEKPLSTIVLTNVSVKSVEFTGVGDDATARITFKFPAAQFTQYEGGKAQTSVDVDPSK